jgi:putative aminopeptidase FrvX
LDGESLEFLEKLCNSSGPSGFEGMPIKLIKDYVTPYADNTYSDKMGNLFFEKVGRKDGPSILIPGHVDEIRTSWTSRRGRRS